ncbi:MAG: hypothetical protein M1813_009651 [Trichoglossum hirsutum]|nr:MAG: hypothetical protein M1813_009651 [Trichoglossum hirsutum]
MALAEMSVTLQRTTNLTFSTTSIRPLTSRVFFRHQQLNETNFKELQLFGNLARESCHLLISDDNVARLYSEQLIDSIRPLGLKIHPIIIPPGEQSKSLQIYRMLLQRSIELGLDKNSTVISFGGGVVKDLSGFLAATLFRGIDLVCIPTTTLAQVDAAIGFKQALNLPQGKNLVGVYHPASEIWINTIFLRSLDERTIRDGLSESVKIALCHSKEFLEALVHVNPLDIGCLTSIVEKSVLLKIEVMRDEGDRGEAVRLYGHAIGHALEHLSCGESGHGESIAIGMCISAELSVLLNIADSTMLQQHYTIFKTIGLPTKVPSVADPEKIWDQICYDKHFVGGTMHTAILQSIGVVSRTAEGGFTHAFDKDIVLQAIHINQSRKD